MAVAEKLARSVKSLMAGRAAALATRAAEVPKGGHGREGGKVNKVADGSKGGCVGDQGGTGDGSGWVHEKGDGAGPSLSKYP